MPPEAGSNRQLTPEQWRQIRDLLATVIQLPTQDRPVYLDEVCQGDAALRAELDSLIAAHEFAEEGQFEHSPVPTDLSDYLCSDLEQARGCIGRRFGSYRIEAEIGRGGMGTVYRARRDDDRFSKEVAIKFLDRGVLSRRSLELFKHERQILANLEHPNIARLLDAGESEDGLPYFTMEYVDGEPVDVYCDAHRLTIEQRLLSFLKVCAAVHYAHRNLVIHRDIKPDNILVTHNGDPKLLDFGIAKIVDLNNAGKTVTATTWFVMTPAYASPEQLLGKPLSIATDIYSLGLVLYELLTGRYAYDEAASAVELQRAILEEDPHRPSTAIFSLSGRAGESGTVETISDARRLTPQKLARVLRGDLESIVLKAVRKEPSQRYTSVQHLSEDIECYLKGLPVKARQSTKAYRLRKFVLRNRTAVIGGGLIFLLLLAGIGFILREDHIARLQQARAERRFNDVHKLANSLLFEFHDAIQDLPGSTPARKLIVERSLQYLDSLSSESSSDVGLLRELATAYERVGELQGQPLVNNLGETTNSLASHQKALKLRQQLGDHPKAEWQDRLRLAESYRRMAGFLSAAGDTRSAVNDLEKAISITESMSKNSPNDLDVLFELGSDYEVLGLQGGDLAVVLQTDQKAMAAQEHILSIDPGNVSARRARANDAFHIADAQMDLGHTEEALGSFHNALNSFLSISDAPRDRRRAAAVYNQIGMLYDRTGNFRLCVENHRRALEIYKRLVSEDPKNALFRQGLAISYANVGDAESQLGRWVDSVADINRGMTIMKAIVEGDPNSDQRDILAQMHCALADVFARFKKFQLAIPEYRIALQIREVIYRSNRVGSFSGIAEYKVRVADAERRSGDLATATADFQEALTLSVPELDSNDDVPRRNAANAYAGLGDIEAARASRLPARAKQRRWEQAVQYYKRSLDVGKRVQLWVPHDLGNFDVANVERRLRNIESALYKLGVVRNDSTLHQ